MKSILGGVRFAPSPTGRFHLGNLRTAWVSHLLARHFDLPWVVRFEDIDEPRNAPGARASQLDDLRELHLHPDVILTQSQFRDRHWQLFRRAVEVGQLYACNCSRQEVQVALAALASAPHHPLPSYSGRCRERQVSGSSLNRLAWRFRMPNPSGSDDFIVARTSAPFFLNQSADANSFSPAYHWACAIDDDDGGHELLVRAIDLASAVPIQRAVQTWLATQRGQEARFPAVFHCALVMESESTRLEKRTRGTTLPELIASGFSPRKLGQRFAASFQARDLPARLQPGAVFAEAISTLTQVALLKTEP